jgi:translation elongation factor EF-4
MSDAVKQCSAGYASLNYEDAGYKESDLVKVEIAVNGTINVAVNILYHHSVR